VGIGESGFVESEEGGYGVDGEEFN